MRVSSGAATIGARGQGRKATMRLLHSRNQLRILVGCAALWCAPAFAQAVDPVDGPPGPVVNLADGPVNVVIRYSLPQASGQAVSPDPSTETSALSAGGLVFYSTHYTALAGKQVPFNIVGANPTLGASTTTIRTVLVPLK